MSELEVTDILVQHLKEPVLIFLVHLNWYSLVLDHQHAWEMENGNQIPERWNAKVRMHTIMKISQDLKLPHITHITAYCDLSTLPANGYIISDNASMHKIEGTIVTFSCPGNHQKLVNCTAEGHWEPNSSNICAEATDSSGKHNFVFIDFEYIYTSITVGGSVEPTLSRDGKIAVASSITVSTVMSILFFIVGFLCGHFYRRERKMSETGQAHTPYYDDVVLRQHTGNEQQLELKENVAYAQVR